MTVGTNIRGAYRRRFGAPIGARLATDAPADPPAESPVYLRREIARLERELETAQQQARIAALVKSVLRGCVDHKPPPPPEWTVAPSPRRPVFHGTPTLFLSDIHHGEVVFPAQVANANAFNCQISRRRLERVITKTIHILDNVFTGADYPGIVLALGGDMVSGTIHEELSETNEVPIFDAVLDLADALIAAIRLLKRRFGRVFVPCVVGNHGRIHKKPRCKHGPHDNYEYILYHYIGRAFDGDDAVTVHVSDSFSCHYRLYATRYLLTHGDGFRGGSGIAGPIVPWALGDHRLRKQMGSLASWTDSPTQYDVLLFGHWHTYFPSRAWIANGTLKGFDEYASKSGFSFEPPTQALWLTEPTYGPTFHAPIYAEEPPARRQESDQWLSIPR